MHVALVANTAWLDEELTTFRSMVIGLIDEQVRVTQVVPTGLADEVASGFCTRVTWQDSSWSVIRRRRLSRLADRLGELEVDLIHALDGRVWSGAVGLAQRLGVPLVMSASSVMDISESGRLGRAGWLEQAAYIATSDPLAAAIREKLGDDVRVEAIPHGVHVPDEPRSGDEEDGTLCAVVTGSGGYDGAYDVLMVAIRSIIDQYPQSQFFFDGQGGEQHLLWQHARRHGLLANMSLVPRRLGHRELLLKADVLIQPQALERSRSLTLAAMARGVPVIALQDPWLDYLIDGQTAWVVERPDPKTWFDLIAGLIEEPTRGKALAESARQWLRQRHLAAQQMGKMLALYKEITGESIKFPGVEAQV